MAHISSSMDKKPVCIALDVMGGDHAPESVIHGANIAIKSNANLKFILCGDKNKFMPFLDKFPALKKASNIIHTEEFISSEEKPSVALRKSRNTSMRLAINTVKEGRAQAIVSSGNTGALMAIAKLVFRTLEDIDRPAIASTLPTLKGSTIMLDMGANAACDANNLMQFAIMGDAFAKIILNKSKVSIGLLNIGSEELKGHEVVRVAHQIIQEEHAHLNYYGYVEGDDIMKGTVDVVVTDGFTGNIALKAIEGTAKLCKSFLNKAYRSSPITLLGYLLSSFSLRKVFRRLDPRSHNGAMFLGLNGIAIKSHGNADKVGFAHAIQVAVNLSANEINEKIIEELNISNNSIKK